MRLFGRKEETEQEEKISPEQESMIQAIAPEEPEKTEQSSRKNQQDSLAFRWYGAYGLLACVCDGMGGLAYVDTPLKGIELQKGDLILLCSDGFYREYPEAALIQRLQLMDEDNFTEWAAILAGEVAARRPPHMDNTSLILIRYNKALCHVNQKMTNRGIINRAEIINSSEISNSAETSNNKTIHNEIIK